MVLERLPKGARVAVIRLRSLGDTVLTTPALALLRRHRPDLRIAVALEPRFQALLEGNTDVDEVLGDDLFAVRRFAPDLCLNLHGGTRSLKMTAVSGARWKAGFGHYQLAGAYNVRIPRAQEVLGEERKVHTAEHLASAMFYLGVPRGPIPRARLEAGESPEIAGGPYAVLHPFASQAQKTWPAANFVELARRIHRELGFRVIVLAGPGEDTAPFEDAARIYQCAPLAVVKSILGGATVFAGNDSGPAHMAAAFGLPVVVLFGNSDHEIWAPWRTQSRVHLDLARLPVADVFASVAELRAAVAGGQRV